MTLTARRCRSEQMSLTPVTFKEMSVAFGFTHQEDADEFMYAAPLISDLLLVGFNSSNSDAEREPWLNEDQLVRDFHLAWILLRTKLVDAVKICKLSKWRLRFTNA